MAKIIATRERESRQLRVGTVFSGIGAFEHALERLGIPYDIVFACDINEYCKKTYFANFKITEQNWYSDINKVDGDKYRNKIDIMMGGSPCQSFSTVGNQKGLQDDRGNLIFSYINLIKKIKPNIFIFENVKGLLSNNKGETFKIVKKAFESTGYKIVYKILNAKDFGIPQHRERLYLIGFKNQKIKFDFPESQKLKYVVRDFLEDKADPKYYLPKKGIAFVTGRTNHKYKCQINADIMITQKSNQQFNWHGDFVTDIGKPVDSKYFLSESVKKYVLSTGTKNYKTNPKTDLDIARPLLSTMGGCHRAGVDNYYTYGEKIRKLTPRECLRLMGFTDKFKIVVSDTQAYKQAGNSIVVNVLMSILTNIFNRGGIR